jgi:hypothetical protein
MAGQPTADPALDRALETMQAALDAVRQSISRELATIPPPVPACDVNFNRLLDDRAKVVDELQALARLRADGPDRERILAFCRTANGLDAQSELAVETILGAPGAIAGR